jgi:hypothetical protein
MLKRLKSQVAKRPHLAPMIAKLERDLAGKPAGNAPVPASRTATTAPTPKLTGFARAQAAFTKPTEPTVSTKETKPKELTGLARAHAAFNNKQQSTK